MARFGIDFIPSVDRLRVVSDREQNLRINPNDEPDADFGGYNFWLVKLNQFNGDFVQAEMVRAFISSIEYRQRFGQ